MAKSKFVPPAAVFIDVGCPGGKRWKKMRKEDKVRCTVIF